MSNIGSAQTTVTTLTNAVKTFYEKVFFEALWAKLIMRQFAQIQKVNKGEGKSIIWNRPVALSLGYALTEGMPLSVYHALSTTKVSAIASLYGEQHRRHIWKHILKKLSLNILGSPTCIFTTVVI